MSFVDLGLMSVVIEFACVVATALTGVRFHMFKKISTGNKISYTEAGGRIRLALAGQRGWEWEGDVPPCAKGRNFRKTSFKR